MSNKYPSLPQPFYDRGDFGPIHTDCYNDEQMRTYADAAREGWLSPEDVKRLRGALEALADYVDERTDDNECRPLENARTTLATIDAARAAGQVPPKRQDDAPLDFGGDFEEDLWDERDE